MNLSTLQAYARVKFKDDRGKYTLYNDQLLTLDALILSTVLAVREEVMPEVSGVRLMQDGMSHDYYGTHGYNEAVAEISRRFDSLLGGDAKRV